MSVLLTRAVTADSFCCPDFCVSRSSPEYCGHGLVYRWNDHVFRKHLPFGFGPCEVQGFGASYPAGWVVFDWWMACPRCGKEAYYAKVQMRNLMRFKVVGCMYDM